MGTSRKPDRPEEGGAPGGRTWSRPPEDLAGDRVLRNCAKTPLEGVSRPSIGPYVILSRLGQGGMGVVFLAAHSRLASEFAIKVLPAGAEQQIPGARDRFEREAKIAARVKSDHLVRVLDVDEDPASGSRYIVMEYVHGRAADAWADGRRSGDGVSEADALDVCIAATRGLADAHATSILHRDVKPGNVLIPDGRDGRPDLLRAKLADLGLAREETHGATLTGTGTGLGTPGYMAPEQLRDAKRAGRTADVFSMGATLYALLTGSGPFDGATAADAMLRTIAGEYPPLASRRPGTSEATVALVATCLSADPGARFASATTLLRALETARSALDTKTASKAEIVARVKSFAGVAAEGGVAAEPVATASGRAVRRRPAVVAAAVGVVAVAAIVYALGARAPSNESPSAPPTRTKAAQAPPGTPPKPAPESPPPAPVAPVVAPGLYITSTPSGAAVTVDGAPQGLTPTRVTGLSTGRHVVDVRAPHYRAFRTDAATATDGEKTTFHADLVRGAGRVEITGGAPGAAVALTAVDPSGEEPRALTLDGDGAASADLPEGRWTTVVTARGHDPFRCEIQIEDGATRTVAATTQRHPSRLAVRTKPPGASVTVGGVGAGVTPLDAVSVAAGTHAVAIELRAHELVVRDVVFPPGEAVDLGEIALAPWPVLDLSALGEGVTAAVGGRAVAGTVPVAPGAVAIVLSKKDHADQTIPLDLESGEARVVQPEPWPQFQAVLDLKSLPRDATATDDGAVLAPPSVGFPSARTVHVVLTRKGYWPLAVDVDLAMGRSVPLPKLKWESRSQKPSAQESYRQASTMAIWRSLSTSERRNVADAIGELDPDLDFEALRTYECGGKKNEIAVFRHPKTGLAFCLIPGGSFDFGDAGLELARPVHAVTISAFFLCQTECTQRAWERVAGIPCDANHKAPDLPVENVSWKVVEAWCSMAGLSLPTEAQWEYACRAGTTTQWCFGGDAAELSRYAWFADPVRLNTMDVGTKLPNAFGLFDVHGNAGEYCSDYYKPTYDWLTDLTDPMGPAQSDNPLRLHLYRGGSFVCPAAETRSAYRPDCPPEGAGMTSVAFRPARRLRL